MTRARLTLAALTLAALALAALAGCGTQDPSDSPSADGSKSPTAASCAGGTIRLLQGQPTDLPGGGSAGIGQVDKQADPPTVRLALGGTADGEKAGSLAVGDTFTVQGTAYRITCISASKVTAEPGT